MQKPADSSTLDPIAHAGLGRRFSALLERIRESILRHRLVHAFALVSLLIGVWVGIQTGNSPDLKALKSYGTFLLIALWLTACLIAIYRLFHLAVFERHPSPARELAATLVRFFANHDRIANGLNGFGAFIIFASGYGVLKGAIAILRPFSWDQFLAELDIALHFGRPPHEWLWWIIERPFLVLGINFTYNLWFYVMIVVVLTAAVTAHDSDLRHRFLVSFMLTWLVGGFLVAMGFSSAGPCFFARIGLGDTYQPLMDALAEANRSYPIWAISTQEMLWDGFTGERDGSAGISAFPSMHVALAVLLALYASNRSFIAGAAMWLFAAMIMIGSVVLAWHYAVDGYAGALLAWFFWSIAGFWYKKRPPLPAGAP